MPAFTAKRTSDNLLYVPDYAPELPADGGATVRQNAQRALGGALEDWVFVSLTDEQYAAMTGQTGRAYLNGESVVLKTITLTSSASTVAADGVAVLTLTANVGEAGYTGTVKFTVTAPNGVSASETVAAVAGVAQTTMNTLQTGTHAIVAEAVAYGLKQITVEGV